MIIKVQEKRVNLDNVNYYWLSEVQTDKWMLKFHFSGENDVEGWLFFKVTEQEGKELIEKIDKLVNLITL